MNFEQASKLDYAHRNRILADMGFASYVEYLRSNLWVSIRSRVMENCKGKCLSCGGKATQVHHPVYSKGNLTGKSIETLVGLCNTCHKWLEFEGEEKLPFVCVLAKLRKHLMQKIGSTRKKKKSKKVKGPRALKR